MKKKDIDIIKRNEKDYDKKWYSNLKNVASTNDCTGLIPTPPLSESESKSYTDIQNIPPQKEAKYRRFKIKKPKND